ncbi:hypothetical protein KI387_006666, partial [Taxus chinensis]
MTREISSYYICNPVTRKWKKLPALNGVRRHDFVGLGFDTCTRRCTLVLGINKWEEIPGGVLVVKIYDSEGDEWTTFRTINALSSAPTGEGVFSGGSFYWLSVTSEVKNRLIMGRTGVAALNVENRTWSIISTPQRPLDSRSEPYCHDCISDWNLTGHEGNVVLVYNIYLRLWRLDENNNSWAEARPFPESPCLGMPYTGMKYYSPLVLVNSCGWILVHLPDLGLVVMDSQGTVIHAIEAASINPPRGFAYEINN